MADVKNLISILKKLLKRAIHLLLSNTILIYEVNLIIELELRAEIKEVFV